MSEGNFSAQQVRALAENDLADSQDGAPPASEPSLLEAETARRMWPLYGAAAASVAWLTLALIGAYWAWSEGLIVRPTPTDIAAGVAGIITPVVAFWLMAMVFQRTDPLLERRLALARTLNRAIAPIDAAEMKLNQLLDRLRRDIDVVEKTVELAAERIDNLEDRFQDQVSNLFSATTDAEAKAASIRDQLRRERESVDDMAADLSARARDIQSAMEMVAAGVTSASDEAARTSERISARMGEDRDLLGDTMSSAVNQFSDINEQLGHRARQLEATAVRAEETIAGRIAALSDGEDQYRATLEHLAQRAETVRADVLRDTQALSDLTEQTRERSELLHETLVAGLTGVRDAADAAEGRAIEAADLMAERTTALDEQSTAATERLMATAEGLEARLETALAKANASLEATDTTIGKQMEALSGHSRGAAELLTERLETLERIAAAATAQLEEAIGQASQDAGTKLASARATLAKEADGLVHAAHNVAAEISSELTLVSDDLRDRLSAISNVARTNRDDIKGLSEELGNRAGELAEIAGKAGSDLGTANEALTAQTNSASEAFERIGGRLSALEESLDTRREGLARMSDEMVAKISGALEALASQAEDIEGRVGETTAQIGTDGSELVTRLTAIKSALDNTVVDTRAAVDSFQSTADGLSRLSSENVAAMDEAAARLKSISGEANSVQATVAAMTTTLNAELERVKEAVHQANEAAEQGATQIGTTYLSAMARSRRVASEALEAARATAQDVLATVDQTVEQTLEKLRAQGGVQAEEAEKQVEATAARLGRSLNDTLAQVGLAATRASVTAESAAHRVTEQAEGLLKETSDLANKMTALESRLDTVVRSDLVRTSSLIIEGLNSVAIDIGRVLATDVSDTQWSQYLAGDKSIFTRRTVKLADKSTRKRIAKRYDDDQDFRDHVQRYLRDFELLMARALAGRDSTPLSIALLSSDLGKLYVLLAQSVKRLN